MWWSTKFGFPWKKVGRLKHSYDLKLVTQFPYLLWDSTIHNTSKLKPPTPSPKPCSLPRDARSLKSCSINFKKSHCINLFRKRMQYSPPPHYSDILFVLIQITLTWWECKQISARRVKNKAVVKWFIFVDFGLVLPA